MFATKTAYLIHYYTLEMKNEQQVIAKNEKRFVSFFYFFQYAPFTKQKKHVSIGQKDSGAGKGMLLAKHKLPYAEAYGFNRYLSPADRSRKNSERGIFS